MHSRQRGLVRLRREYPPKFGQQSTIGPFAISETHPLIHEKMTHIHTQRTPSPAIQLRSSTCLGDCEVVDVYKHRPVIRFTICIVNHRRAGPMKRCVAGTKVIGYLFMTSVRGFTRSHPRVRSSGRWCRHREKRRTPKDTREHHTQYNRQTTALHSHRPLARRV